MRKPYILKKVLLYVLILSSGCADPDSNPPKTVEQDKPGDRTNYIRTAGHGLNRDNVDATIKDALETNLFGIEVDNDIPGRYES